MSEVGILDEMLAAGMAAYKECKRMRLTDAEICFAVFMAMKSIEERDEQPLESFH